jgi:microcystin-dependent protein
MPRDLSGNYTLPEGNPVAGGTIIDINWANPTMADIAVQLNNVFTRDGLLGPLASWKLIDGTVAAPSMTFNSELGMGLYRETQNVMGVAINGAAVAKFSTTGVDVAGGIARNGTAIAEVPVGTILDFAGITPPSGYLVCNGQTVSRTTYAALFAVLGGTWGGGDGSTTFHLPDLRRRVAIGSGGTVVSGPGAAVGNVGGQEATVLDNGTLPSHSHGIIDQIHAHAVGVNGTTSTVSTDHAHYVSLGGGGHEHYTTMNSYWGSRNTGNWGWCSDDAPASPGAQSAWTSGGGGHTHEGWSGGISANHTHTWSGTFASDNRYTGINGTQATGGSAAHNTMQPSAVVNKIIKY